jgi:SAM-dependent methyltransferase
MKHPSAGAMDTSLEQASGLRSEATLSAPDSAGGLTLVEVACPLCRSGRSANYLDCRDLQFGVPGEFRIGRCLDCRHVYMNPQPAPESLAACYPDGYVPHQLGPAGADPAGTGTSPAAEESPPAPARAGRGPWYLTAWPRRIPGLRRLYYWLTDTKSQYVPPQAGPTPRALEIGCATGDFLERLARNGWSVRGVELAMAPAEAARRRGFDVHTGTLESAGFDTASFDAVFAWMVIEHLPDPRATLEEIHRLVVPGGWFVFSVPNLGCWEPRVFGRYWLGFDVPRHLQYFTPRSLRRLLSASGFAVERIIHQPSPLYPLGSVGMWLRERFPHRRMGHRMLNWYFQNPPLWVTLLLAPLARLQALVRQSGRLTVIARAKPPA